MNLTVSAPGTDAVSATAWRTYQGVNSGDLDQKELIERYLPLIRNVVGRIKLNLPSHIDADDLYSVGVTGLIAAVRKYDPEQGSTFPAYASMRIRGAILDDLRRMDWCPRRARARSRKMKEAINVIEQRVGRTAEPEEIRAHLKLNEKEFAKWDEDSKPVTFIAIDQRADSAESTGPSLHDLLQDPQDVTGRDRLEQEELVQLLTERMKELPEVPRKILAMYYFENLRLAEIAAVFDLTESRISQIHSQTILGLRAYLARAQDR